MRLQALARRWATRSKAFTSIVQTGAAFPALFELAVATANAQLRRLYGEEMREREEGGFRSSEVGKVLPAHRPTTRPLPPCRTRLSRNIGSHSRQNMHRQTRRLCTAFFAVQITVHSLETRLPETGSLYRLPVVPCILLLPPLLDDILRPECSQLLPVVALNTRVVVSACCHCRHHLVLGWKGGKELLHHCMRNALEWAGKRSTERRLRTNFALTPPIQLVTHSGEKKHRCIRYGLDTFE